MDKRNLRKHGLFLLEKRNPRGKPQPGPSRPRFKHLTKFDTRNLIHLLKRIPGLLWYTHFGLGSKEKCRPKDRENPGRGTMSRFFVVTYFRQKSSPLISMRAFVKHFQRDNENPMGNVNKCLRDFFPGEPRVALFVQLAINVVTVKSLNVMQNCF